jgi:hypothetical protein
MAHVSYIGGKNGKLEGVKAEALALANDMTRLKLAQMRGTLVSRKEVSFVIRDILVILQQKFLQLPRQVLAELRDLDPVCAHSIQMHVDSLVRQALKEAVDSFNKAMESTRFVDVLRDENETAPSESEAAKADAEYKHMLALARRRERRREKLEKG